LLWLPFLEILATLLAGMRRTRSSLGYVSGLTETRLHGSSRFSRTSSLFSPRSAYASLSVPTLRLTSISSLGNDLLTERKWSRREYTSQPNQTSAPKGNVVQVTDKDFTSAVLDASKNGPVILDCYAEYVHVYSIHDPNCSSVGAPRVKKSHQYWKKNASDWDYDLRNLTSI